MKPGIKIDVGTALGTQGLIGADVRSSKQKLIKNIKEGDDWFFIFKDPGDILYVKSVHKELSVTITNHLSVNLVLEIKLADGTVLDDVLKNGRRYHLAYYTSVKARI